MGLKTATEHQAAQDASKIPALIAVSGTVGTSDTTGTAQIVRVGANPSTGALYVQDLSGAGGTTNIAGTVVVSNAEKGTITKLEGGTLGEVTTLTNGTVRIPSGTITTGSLSDLTNLYSGSVRMTVGTVTTGSLTDLTNLYSGSVRMTVGTVTTGSLTDVAKLYSGTINVGTFVLPSGTITTGSLTDVAKLYTGTITTIAAGTQNTLGTVGVINNVLSVAEVVKGTTTLVSTVTTVSNLTNGSVNLLTGTVTSVTNLAGGTVQINPVPVPATLTYGTLGTAGGSFFATLSAASGVGTKHYVTGVDIVMQSGTADVRVLVGSAIQGAGVLAAGFFPAPGGGISNKFDPALVTATNTELIYHFVGAGTAFIRVSYWKGT